MNKSFWKHKKVLITGHTGFKGSWLSLWLQHNEANLCGIALAPLTTPNLFTLADIEKNMESHLFDICDFEKTRKIINHFQPEIIFHLAAQPLVRYSYSHPIETYMTNVMGTVHILEAAKSCKTVKAVVNVTTDKCYENKERMEGYKETERLGGYDPYSNSKACSELVSSAYYNSFYQHLHIGLATARAGNVIGGGDWSEDRLITDVINSIVNQKPLILRNPTAIRPWQHVLEPLSGYLLLAEELYQDSAKYSGAWNFGPHTEEVLTVEEVVKKIFSRVAVKNKGYVIEPHSTHLHEAHLLQLDITKVMTQLNWKPQLKLDQAIDRVTNWYEAWMDKKDMREYSLKQIQEYDAILDSVPNEVSEAHPRRVREE